jgi:riboflavin transporter FmnP
MTKTQKLAIHGMLAALAYITLYVSRLVPIVLVPAVPQLKYDPKDIIIIIGGFLFGPLSAFAVSAVVSLVEWFTISTTGFFGFVMNVISTCSFACVAAAVYKRKRGSVMTAVSLAIGVLAMCPVMLLWNYIITPIYFSIPRADIAPKLIPAYLPFNLIKGGLNAGITLLIFTPLYPALSKANLLPVSEEKSGANMDIGVVLAGLFVVITCVLLVLVYKGDI